MPTYIVTGTAGFIGNKVAEQLLDAGHQVHGIDCVNADIQSYDQLRENHIAAATAQQFNTTA